MQEPQKLKPKQPYGEYLPTEVSQRMQIYHEMAKSLAQKKQY